MPTQPALGIRNKAGIDLAIGTGSIQTEATARLTIAIAILMLSEVGSVAAQTAT